MSVDGGVFEKFVGLRARLEFLFRQKSVVFAFNFASAGWASCARNGVNELRSLPQRVDECRFSGAGWRRKDKQDSGSRESVTQGFEFARGFFRVRLCKGRRAVKSRHRLLSRQACSVREKFPE